MKVFYLKVILIIEFLFAFINIDFCNSREIASDVSGKVTDEDKNSIAFVSLTLQEISITVLSDKNGNYIFTSVPEGEYHLTVTRNGYLSKTINVNVSGRNIKENIVLKKGLIETPVIDVTTSFNPLDIENTPFSITSIPARKLSKLRSFNIAETIQNIPGVNNISTGTSIGKPVIRGLSSQSVIILHDGIKHESQQWGDEHGPEISLFNIDRIEIIRGPASLMYGADGIGGVINIIASPLIFSQTDKPIKFGKLDVNGFSVNNEGAGAITLGAGLKNISLKGYAGYRKGGNIFTPSGNLTINTPDGQRIINGGELFNTGNREREAGIILGSKFKSVSINLSYETFNRELQIHEDPSEAPDATPNQKVQTNNFDLKGNYKLSETTALETIFSYENNLRKEFESSEDKQNDNEILNLNLKKFQFDLRMHHKVSGILSGTIGGNYVSQSNTSGADEKLIPNYDSRSIGIYLLEKFEKTLFTISGGFRYDLMMLNTKETVFEYSKSGEPEKIVPSGETGFNSISGSMGVVYKPNSYANIFLNFGKGWRPPSEFELYVDGVHEGTGRYETGLKILNPEYDPEPEESFNIDIGCRINSNTFSGEFSLFRNKISNYIYPSPTNQTDTSSGLQIFEIKQASSLFYGYEYNLQYNPVSWFLIAIKGDYVFAENEVTGNPIPFTPPSKNSLELKFQNRNTAIFYNPYLSAEFKFVSSQTRVDPLESITEKYFLLNAGMGFDLIISEAVASVDLSVTNLLNKRYVDHLSRYKYYALNQGRSINLKLSMPFQF